MAVREGTKRSVHVPATYRGKALPHIYFTERADGSKAYEVRHPRTTDGKRPYETVGTDIKAAIAREREVYATGAQPVSTPNARLEEVYADWLTVQTVKRRSRESYEMVWRVHIKRRFGRSRVSGITALDIRKWLLRPEAAHLASGTRRNHYAVLQVLLAHAVEMGVIPTAPKLKHGKAPAPGKSDRQPMTDEELDKLFGAILGGGRRWLEPIVDVALGQGLRLGEVCALQWEDVDFEAGTITVQRNLGRAKEVGTPKSGKPRTIKLMGRTRKALQAHRLASGRRESWIFVNGYQEVRHQKDVQRAYLQAVRAAELGRRVDFHTLRHTALTRLANTPGVPLTYVRDFAGHSSITVTEGYLAAPEMTDQLNDVLEEAI